MRDGPDPYAGLMPDGDSPAPVWCEGDGWDEAAIPPRAWLAPGYFMRGAVTVLVGGSGLSKSMLTLAYAIALALNRPLNGMVPPARLPQHHLQRGRRRERTAAPVSAGLTSVGRAPSAIAGKVYRAGPAGIGALFERDQFNGAIAPTGAMNALKTIIRDNSIDVLIVDPLAELHSEEENDNSAMRSIAAAFRLLAVEMNIAICIVHHARKGQHTPGDPEASRGASSLIGTARTVLTVVGMTPEEATAFGLPSGAHKPLFRVDGGKANHAPLTECEWFERVGYDLANGDRVAAVVPWTPPADVVSIDTRLSIEAAVAAGSPAGPWSAKLSSDARSIKHLLFQQGVVTASGQRAAISGLHAAGFVVAEFRRSDNRVKAQGLRSPDGLPSNVVWTDNAEA